MRTPTGRALVNAQVAIESFALSPDGGTIVYALRRVRAGRYESHLWAVPWSGGRPRQLTSGAVRDTNPAISSTGQVAFARALVGVEPAAEAQLWRIPLDGGEAAQLTRLPHGAGTARWSPDGRRVAFLAAAGADRFAVGRHKPKRPPTARRVTRTDFRDDESGLLSRRTHLWVIAGRPNARPRQVTSDDFDVTAPAWASDGSWIAFAADLSEDTNILPRSELFRVPASGGKVLPLASLPGDAERPSVSADGRLVAFLGTDVSDPPEDTLQRLFVAPAGGGPPRCLTPDLDRSVGNGGWADLVMADDEPGPVWLDDESLLILVGDRGRNVPFLVTLSGQARPMTEPGRLVSAGIAAAAGRVALSAGIDRHAAELYALERRDTGQGQLRQLTKDGSRWQQRFPLPDWEELWIDGPGGRIQTWLASPPGAARRPRPTIVALHGGPTGAWGPGGTMDATMLAGHGYRVVMPNVRGSATHGSAWVAGLGGRWGDTDAADVLAVVDALVERGLTDARRVGVMGLSYGGYLTQWLIGHTDRFGAAVSENGVTNQVSAWGNSYFGVHYNRRHGLADPLTVDGMQRLWAVSPLSAASAIHTPLLMLQAEEDRICPAADNEQLFTALKVLGREVEYVLYPEEHHEMKNYGRPDRRIDRMERTLGWFDRWLDRSAVRPRATSG